MIYLDGLGCEAVRSLTAPTTLNPDRSFGVSTRSDTTRALFIAGESSRCTMPSSWLSTEPDFSPISRQVYAQACSNIIECNYRQEIVFVNGFSKGTYGVSRSTCHILKEIITRLNFEAPIPKGLNSKVPLSYNDSK